MAQRNNNLHKAKKEKKKYARILIKNKVVLK